MCFFETDSVVKEGIYSDEDMEFLMQEFVL